MSLRDTVLKHASIATMAAAMALAATYAANASPHAVANDAAAIAARHSQTAHTPSAQIDKVHYRHRRYRRPRVYLDFYIGPPPPVYYTPRHYYPVNRCEYWAARCSARWYRRQDYLGCMRYHHCW